jgi:hypothetical protein
MLSDRYLVGALTVVFVLLLAGIVFAGPGEEIPAGTTAKAVDVGALPSPTATAVTIRNASTTATVAGRSTVPRAANASGFATPQPNATVLVIKTLSRYIQNAGGDPGSQLRTPTIPETPTPPTPVPTSASGRAGTLAWSGEGTYVTEPFALDAGTIQVEITAGVLTMVQLRDAAGTAIGIATAGPQPATTPIHVPVTGTYRLEVWPFGDGHWTVAISSGPGPTAAPSLAPATVTTAAPVVVITTEVPTNPETTAPTTVETVTEATTGVPTTEPTQAPTPTPTQPRRSFTGNGTATTGAGGFDLNAGLAYFSYSTAGTGPFSVTLLDSDGAVTDIIAAGEGPLEGSKAISVPATGKYVLNVVAAGPWEVSIA